MSRSVCLSAKCRSARARAAGEISGRRGPPSGGLPSFDNRLATSFISLSFFRSYVHGDSMIITLGQVPLVTKKNHHNHITNITLWQRSSKILSSIRKFCLDYLTPRRRHKTTDSYCAHTTPPDRRIFEFSAPTIFA